ncbi:MAG: class II aldolase/adducin family protein [Planctomycetota bacterium]
MSAGISDQLLELSHELGRPEYDFAILGEGNTSARLDGETFLVKASGSELRTLRPDQVVEVRFDACRDMMDGPPLSDVQIKDMLLAAVSHGPPGLRPSVETVMHAALLGLDGIHFVGHTHPSAINSLACSDRFETALTPRLFPDHVVVCGPSAALVPYVDPGLPLAAAVLESARAYLDEYGEAPKTIYLKNHGFIALGKTANQVAQITHMAVKAARILLGSFAVGSPVFMTTSNVNRIAGRDDEHYRQQVLSQSKATDRGLE